MDPDTTVLLALTAGGTGCLHTLLGPDHYVPIIALARLRRWSPRRAALSTVAFGLAHCLATVALLAAIGGPAVALAGWRSDVAGSLLLGGGLLLTGWTWRRRGSRPATPEAGAGWPVLLSVAFIVGPCEWLAPAALAAFGTHGYAGMAVIVAAFTAATVLTMLAAVAAGSRLGAVLARSSAAPAGGRLIAGVAIAASGATVLLGA